MADKLTDDELFQALKGAEKPTEDVSDDELFEALGSTNFSEQLAEKKAYEQEVEALKEHGGAVATGRGLIQGVTLGFGDEIEGAIKAGMAKMQGDERDYSQIYQDKRDQVRKENMMSQEVSGEAYFTGEILGGIGTSIYGAPITAGVRGAAVLGGLAGVGFSNRTGTDLIKDAAIGATFGAAGEKVFKGVGKRIQNVFKNTKNPKAISAFTELGETKLPRNVEFERVTVKDIWSGKYNSADEWLISENATKLATKGIHEAPAVVDDILKNEFELAGIQLKAAKEAAGDTHIDMDPFITKLEKELSEISNIFGSKQAVNKVKKDILEPIYSGDFGTVDEAFNMNALNVEQAYMLKKNIAEFTYRRGDKDPFINSKEVSKALKNFTNDLINEFNDISDDIRKANQRFTALYEIDELKPKKVEDILRLTNKSDQTDKGKQLKEFVVKLGNYNQGLVEDMVREINPRIKLAEANAEALALTGDFGASTLFRAKAGMAALGPAGVPLALGKGAIYQSAQLLSKAVKLPRNTAGLMRNYEIAFDKLRNISPGLAVAFNDAVVSENIPVIEEIAKQAIEIFPEAFEDGLGFNGQLTQSEQMMLEQQIIGSPMPVRQKMEQLNQVKAGQVPQPTQPQPPFYKTWKAKKEDY
jgi:hypothetical protein